MYVNLRLSLLVIRGCFLTSKCTVKLAYFISNVEMLQLCRYFAPDIGKLDMRAVYAISTQAIRRLRWPYAGHALVKGRYFLPFVGVTQVIC